MKLNQFQPKWPLTVLLFFELSFSLLHNIVFVLLLQSEKMFSSERGNERNIVHLNTISAYLIGDICLAATYFANEHTVSFDYMLQI